MNATEKKNVVETTTKKSNGKLMREMQENHVIAPIFRFNGTSLKIKIKKK